MPSAAPSVLRKGALVRVSGGLQDTGSDVIALAFLDLRSPDGHVERWQGPGRIGAVPDESNVIAALQLWAVEASDQSAFDIACDVARDFRLPEPPAVDQLRCDEVVFEWNHARRAC
jgi:hypothetical protein